MKNSKTSLTNSPRGGLKDKKITFCRLPACCVFSSTYVPNERLPKSQVLTWLFLTSEDNIYMYSKPNYLILPGVIIMFHLLFLIYATLHYCLYPEQEWLLSPIRGELINTDYLFIWDTDRSRSKLWCHQGISKPACSAAYALCSVQYPSAMVRGRKSGEPAIGSQVPTDSDGSKIWPRWSDPRDKLLKLILTEEVVPMVLQLCLWPSPRLLGQSAAAPRPWSGVRSTADNRWWMEGCLLGSLPQAQNSAPAPLLFFLENHLATMNFRLYLRFPFDAVSKSWPHEIDRTLLWCTAAPKNVHERRNNFVKWWY